MKYIVVKVQTSIEPPGQVLIYSEDKSIMYQGPIPEEIKKLMLCKRKEFFYAHIEGDKIVLDHLSEWRKW